MSKSWGLGVAAFVGINSALMLTQIHSDRTEQNYLESAQKAAWASDAYSDAKSRGASKSEIYQLKKEWKQLKERQKEDNEQY
jgi:hypothetical protein